MDDRSIIEQFLARDPEAIHSLAQKYGDYYRTIAKNILSNAEDTEECVNDALLNVWNAIPPHEPEDLATFTGKIVRNTAFNRYRNDHTLKRGGGSTPLILDELSELIPDPNSVETEMDKKILVESLDRFLRDLPQWKRYIMIRRYWYADSVSEIAKACHRSESYVSLTLTRLRRKLKLYLSERGFTL